MGKIVEILSYKASDGKFFQDKSEVTKYQEQLDEVETCSDILLKKGTTSGDSFIQHNAEEVDTFINKSNEIVHKYYPQYKDKSLVSIARYLGDIDSPSYSLYRLSTCIDKWHRRWSQPYYANEANMKEYRTE